MEHYFPACNLEKEVNEGFQKPVDLGESGGRRPVGRPGLPEGPRMLRSV